MALIDIGTTKQLFVDDYLIESMTNTKQVMNPAEKVEENPVLRAERPWEGTHLSAGLIFHDDKDGLFKMRYTTSSPVAKRKDGKVVVEDNGGDASGNACLAVSEDGVHWERPALGLVEFRGSKENNILPQEYVKPSVVEDPKLISIFYTFKDDHDEDPARRFKGLLTYSSTVMPGQRSYLYYSPDACRWTPYEHNPVNDTSPVLGRWGPTCYMGWDPIRQTYAVHMESGHHRHTPLGKRIIGRAESPDMIHWTEAETIIVPDERDAPDTEFYAMPAIAYEGIYVGLLWNFRTTSVTHHPQIVFSRDGIHYDRSYREPFIPQGPKGSFDCNSIYARTPIVHGERILTYYSGLNHRSPETLLELGDKAVSAIGLAVTPLDGFVSLDGAKGALPVDGRVPRDAPPFSQMVTRSFGFSGTRLRLNLRAAPQFGGAGPCEVRVEILGPYHKRLPGFEFDDADPIAASGPAQVVSWKGKSDLSELAGKPIKLRFHFKNGRLYSFQFTRE